MIGNKLTRRHFARLSGSSVIAASSLMTFPFAKLTLASSGGEGEGEGGHSKTGPLKIYNLPGPQLFPESIGYHSPTGNFFVGSLIDGQILRGNIYTGKVEVYLPAGANGCTSAAGIKIDHLGRMFVAGGATGKIFVYEVATARLLALFEVGATPTLVNDFVILSSGDAYVTDSSNPFIYRIRSSGGNAHPQLIFEKWLALSGTPVVAHDGINLNGITTTAGDNYLIVGQTNTGKLFRISVSTKEVTEIDLAGQALVHCDGILLEKHRLYVTRNAENLLVTLRLDRDFLKGKVLSNFTTPSFHFPTALASTADHRLLVLNAQLDRIGTPQGPSLPFTVVSVAKQELVGQH